MQCPTCGSDNTQSFQMAYENGAQVSTSTSKTFGSGSGGRSVGAGAAVTMTQGSTSTKLAQRTAPPPHKPIARSIMIMFVGGGLAGMLMGTMAAVLVVGGAAISAGLRYQYNKNELPKLYAEWKRNWICHKCGTTYQL